MKIYSFISSLLLACYIASSVFASTVARYPSVSAPHLQQGRSVQLVFDKPVVSAKEVGTPVKPGFLSVSPELKCDSSWVASNVLELKPQEPVPFRAVYDCTPAEGASFADGTPVPRELLRLEGRRNIEAEFVSHDRYYRDGEIFPWESFFVIFSNNAPGEEALLQKAYFATIPDENQQPVPPVRIIPAQIRQATLQECRSAESYRVKDLALYHDEYKNKPGNTLVKGFYIVQPESFFSYGDKYRFVIPQDSPQEDSLEDLTPWARELGKVARMSAYDSYHQESPKTGRLTLGWTQPVQMDNVEQFFKDKVQFSVNADNRPLTYNEKLGGFACLMEDAATGEKREGVIKLDMERLKKLKSIRPGWYTSLPLLVEAANPVFKLTWKMVGVRSVDVQALNGGSSVEIRPESSSLHLDAGNNGIMSAGSKRLTASFCNLKDLVVRGYRIRDGYQHQTFSAYNKIYERNQSAPLSKTISDKDVNHFLPAELLATDGRGVLNVGVDGKTKEDIGMDAIFGSQVKPGMYFIEVEGRVSAPVLSAYKRFGVHMPNRDQRQDFDKDQASYAVQAVVQVTDLGVLYKKTSHDIFVYAYSLATGKAVNHADVQLLGPDGERLASSPIKEGTCNMALPEATAYMRVVSGEDSYITPLVNDWRGRVGLWTFEIPSLPYGWTTLGLNPSTTPETKLFMFSDRNIYRPSETMHLKGVIRTLLDNRLTLSPVEEVKLTVRDEQGKEVDVRHLVPTASGTFNVDYTFPSGETGTYRVQAALRMKGDAVKEEEESEGADHDDDKRYARQSLRRSNREFVHYVEVAEFKRNEFEVEARIAELQPGAPVLKADVKAMNFTGTPVSKGKIDWSLSSTFTNFYPPNYKDYRFGNHLEYDGEYWDAYYGYPSRGTSSDVQNQSARLNDQGEAHTEFPLAGRPFPMVQRLTLGASVTNGNEQLIKTTRKTVWYPSSVFLGIRNASSIARQGTPLELKFLAVGLDGKPYAAADLPLKLTVRRTAFRPTRYDGDGTTTVRNEEETTTVLEDSLTLTPTESANIQTGGKPVSIPTKDSGIYEVSVSGRDPEGRAFRTAMQYWVYGSDSSPWEYMDGLQVKIIPDKQLYQAGDTAKLLIQTPIEGSVVVTVERDKVIRSFTRTLTLDNPVVEVPLEEGDAPNVYVSVFLAKGAELSNRKVKNPQLKLGYATLNIQPARNTLHVQLQPPSGMSLPGSVATVSGVITNHEGKPVRNADVCLYAEDEGTLQVIGYNTPQPLKYFYATRPLSVGTWTTLEQLLDEDLQARSFDNKGMFIGGAAGCDIGSAMGAQEALRLRKDFNPCAVWLASITTDDQGRFKASYTNPDTLTRYRVMAVAVAGNEDFGSGESSYVVNKPIMLEPAPPFTATVGDSLDIPVTVSQTGTRAGKWVVTLQSNDLASVAQPSQTMTLKGNEPQTLIFNVQFKQSGESRLRWHICAADDTGVPYASGVYSLLKDAVENTFEVVPPFPDLRELRCFSLSSGKTLNIPELITTPFVKGTPIQLTLSTSPLIYADGCVNYLLRYPYGCLEQLSSSTLPWIYEPLLAKYLPGFKGKSAQERTRAMNSGIQKILSNQRTGGSLGYWKDSKDVSEYCAYAALVLTLAKENGAYVPENQLKSLYTYLSTALAATDNQDMLGAWVLARAGRLPESLLNILLDRSETMNSTNRLFLSIAVALSPRKDAKELARKLIALSPIETNEGNARIVHALAEMAVDADNPSVRQDMARLIMERTSLSFGGRPMYSTWSAGWDVILVGEYLKGLTETASTAAVHVEEGPQTMNMTCSLTSPARFAAAVGSSAVMTLPDPETTIYGMAEAHGRSPVQQDGKRVDKGFDVSRIYEKRDASGKWTPTEEFTVGDLVRITLNVQKVEGDLTYVVMEDYLASAFEAINPALLSQIPGGTESEVANPDDRWFYWSPWTSNREFLKDRVRFFLNNWRGDGRFTARYMARATKSGRVIAPSAKAELMYKPETYGLSIPLHFSVAPGK